MLRLEGYRWSGRLTIRTEHLHLCATFSETLPSMVAASRPRPLEGILESTRDWKTIGISVTMGVSGGVLNPAVTIGLLLGKKLPGRNVIPYIISQLIGATLAVVLLMASSPSSAGAAAHWGAPTLSNAISVGQGILF